jgi:hypothetical protein
MQTVSMMIYSPPGHGKTTLLGTAVGDNRLSPMLLIDFEAGVDSIQSKCAVFESLKEMSASESAIDIIDVLKVKVWEDFEGIVGFLQANPGRYKSVALDSLSEMNYLNLSGITEEAAAKTPRHDQDVPEMQDYLRSSFQMRKLVRQFRNLPANSFWTAGVAEIANPLTKLPEVVPSLTGKLTREIPGLVLIVGYLAIMEDEDHKSHRSLLAQPTGRYTAKDRSEGGKLGEYVMDPTLPGIFDLLEIPHPTQEE